MGEKTLYRADRSGPGLRAPLAAAACALVLHAATAVASWSDHFEGDRLSSAWTVDRSSDSKGTLRIERGRLAITAEEARYHHIERRLGLDGTDSAPLRVDCQISASTVAGLPTILALYWGPKCVIAVGPAGRHWNECGPRALWIVGDERGASPVEYGLGSRDTLAHYRITVTKRDVSAWASRDGELYWRIATLERSPGRFDGPPELLILGRGWVGDDPKQQRPDLDNDVGNIYQKQLHTFVFDALSVTNDVPAAPPAAPAGYEKLEDWEKTLDSYRSRLELGPWYLLGPLAPRRTLYGPERDGLRAPRVVVHEGEGFGVELPNTPALRGVQEGDYTLAAWVRPDAVPPSDRPEEHAFAIVMKQGWHLGLYYSNERRFVMNHVLADGNQVAAKSSNVFPPGSFHHVVGVVSKTRGAVEVYVDGKLEGSATFPAGKPARDYGDTPWRLGVAMPGAQDWRFEMDGAIDDARIYRAALSAEEVAALHAEEGSPKLLAAVADDPDGGDCVLSPGDTLTLLFDSPTNRPPVRTKADVDGLVDFGRKRLGASYSGTWRDDRTLVITIRDSTGGDLAPGDELRIVADGKSDLRTKSETSTPCVSSARLSGDWGAPPPEGIVGWWKLDETKGAEAADSSGRGNTGKLLRSSEKGSYSWRSAGALPGTRGSLRLAYWKHPDSNRTEGAHVEVADSPSLDPRGALTIALWANADRWGNYGFYWPALVRKEGQYELGSHEVNLLRFYLELPSGTEFVQAPAPPAGTWHHLAATYDGQRMRLFVDGKEVASKAVSGEIRVTTSPLRIGTRLEGESKFYDGLLDDVRIYERALGEAEIAALARFETSTGPLVGHWRLDETEDTIAFDSSGHGAHGRVSGGVWTKGRVGGAVAPVRKEVSWVRHEPAEDDAPGVIDFARIWAGERESATGFACVRIAAEEPRNERIIFSGTHRVEVFLNGMSIGAFESEDEFLVPDRWAVTVALARGENDLVFKVTRRRGPWRLVCRREPANPLERIALLGQLSSDFPDETERVFASKLETARLWESAGCLARAADAFAEAAAMQHVPPEETRAAIRERVRLLKLLRDDARAASVIQAMVERTPQGSPERQELELELLESVARAEARPSEPRLKEALARIGQSSRTNPALLARALSLLAGLAEERGDQEERISWLRSLLRECSAVERVRGLPETVPSQEVLAVECAEAIVAPARTAIGQGKPIPEKALREGLLLYKEALASLPSAKDALVAPVLADAEKALAEGRLSRALELFPLAYVRSCLAESEAGSRMLGDIAGVQLPPPQGEPGKRNYDRTSETVKTAVATRDQVTGWHVVGPFDNTNWKAYEEEIVAPDKVDVTRPVRGRQWRVPPPEAYARGFLDLRALMDADHSVAFLYREIDSPADRQTELRIGSDDGCTVWVNGAKLHEDREQRTLVPDQIVVPVRLRKGKNSILVRSQNGTSDWAFTMRIGGPHAQVPDLARLLYLLEYFPERHVDIAQGLLNFEGELLRTDRFDEAVAIARVLTKAFPTHPYAQSLGACGIADFGARWSRDLRTAVEFADWVESCAERRAFREEPGCLVQSRRLAAGALRAAGDLAGAAERLRRLVRSAAHEDLVTWALVELGSLYRDAGVPHLAARQFRDALTRGSHDENLRRQAYTALEELRRARPQTAAFDCSSEAQTLIRTADRAARGGGPGALERALRGYQQAIEEHTRGLYKLGSSKLVGVAEYCADRIRTMGPEAVKTYRELFDARAKTQYERASSDAEALERIAIVYPLSSFAGDALNAAGNLWLLRGAPARAAAVLRGILADHPDTDLDRAMLLAKLAFAEEHAGKLPAAVAALDELAKKHASTQLVVSGRRVLAGEYASEQKRRLGSRVSPPPERVRDTPPFEVRFQEDPTDLAARRFLWPSPYRHVVPRAATDGGAIFFHTFEEAFSLELDTGRLRWRSGPRTGISRLLAPRFGGMPEAHPALGDGRVFVRTLAAAPADDPSQPPVFALEARDVATGELVWSTETATALSGLSCASPPVSSGGTVYAAFQESGEGSRVWAVALDGATGRVLWRTALAGGVIGLTGDGDEQVRLGDHLCAPAVGSDAPGGPRGDVYFSTDLGAVAALHSSTGAIRWVATYPRAFFQGQGFSREKRMLAGRAPGRVVVGEEAIYVAPRDALAILCIDRSNGDIVWRNDLSDARMIVGLVPARRLPAATRDAAQAGRPAATGARPGALLVQGVALECLDAASGSRLWRSALPPEAGALYGACEIAGDRIWTPAEKGLCRLLSSNGALEEFVRWEELGVSGPVGNLTLLDGALIGLDGSRVARLNLETSSARGGDAVPRVSKAAAVGRLEIPGTTLRGLPLAGLGPAGAEGEAPDESGPKDSVEWKIPRALLGETPLSVHEPADASGTERYLNLAGAIARVNTNERRLDWLVRVGLPPARLVFSKSLAVAIYPRHLTALDRATGEPRWTHAMTSDDSGFRPDTWDDRPFGEVSAGEELVVARQVDSLHVHVLDAKTGTRISKMQIQGCLCVLAAGEYVVAGVADDKGRLSIEARNGRTGAVAWRQPLEFRAPNPWSVRAFADGGRMIFYSEGRLLRFDAAERKVVFNEPVRSLGNVVLRSEGGYLVLSGREGNRWDRWWTVCVDPGTGKLLLDEPTPDGDMYSHRFSPGRVVTVSRRERERDRLFVCRRLPGGEELWRSACGSHEEQSLGGLACGRLWVELFVRTRGKRAHTWAGIPEIGCRAFELEGGANRFERKLPGSPPVQGQAAGPLFSWADGVLLYCTREGVSATRPPAGAEIDSRVAGPPPSSPRGPTTGAGGSRSRRAERTLAERLGPAGARVSLPVFATTVQVRVDGRLDDWEGVEPARLGLPADARSLGGSWKGPQDLSCNVRVQWDRRRVYVSAEVADDIFVPCAPGARLSSGDSLLVGIDPKDCGADSPDPQADVILEIALVEGRTRMRQLRGPNVDSSDEGASYRAVRTDSGLVYELAIPWASLRPSPDERPGGTPAMGLGVAVIDKDGPGDVSALELGRGLVHEVSPALFAGLVLVDIARERLSQFRKFIDLLPSHPLSRRFLERILQASPDRAAELEGFLKAHPDSAHAGAALAALALEYRRAAPPVGEPARASRTEPPDQKAAAFALRAGVPKRKIGDGLGPGSASGGLGRAIRQWVYLDPENPPDALMLQFHSSEGWWSHRAYWGADRFPWGRPFTRERWPLGELPPAGSWVELVVPVDALGFGDHVIHHVSFASSRGRVWWDRTEYVSDGNARVLLDDDLPDGVRFEGGARAEWVETPVRWGRRSHTAGVVRDVAEYHTGGATLGVDFRQKLPPETPAELRARLELVEKGAHLVAEENESLELLREAEALHRGPDGKESLDGLWGMYERFLRSNPKTPMAYRVLGRMRALSEKGAASEAERAGAIRRCEALVSGLGIDREQRRLFYRDFAPGIRQWKVLGYFDPGTGARSLETALPPETFPVATGATYPGPEGTSLSWRDIRAEDDTLKLWELLPAPIKQGTEYPVAYLYTRLHSPRAQRAVLFLGCGGGLQVWVNGRRAGASMWGEYQRDSIAIPVQLSSGTNDILLKVVHQRAAAQVSCRVADGNGRPLDDVAPRLPLAVVSASAAAEPPRVTVVFSGPLEKASAETAANYRIDGGGVVESARLGEDGRTVVLATSALDRGTVYTLSVSGVRDGYSPPMAIEPGTTRRFRVVGTGRGLLGEYFGNMDFTDLKATRIDPVVDFDWGDGQPHPSVGENAFSVRWTGQVEPLFSETYTFHTISDDGVRLWVDGKLVIDNWTDHAPTENTGSIELAGYRRYEIRMEMYENGGGAVAKLLWSSPSQPREPVPTTQLYPPR